MGRQLAYLKVFDRIFSLNNESTLRCCTELLQAVYGIHTNPRPGKGAVAEARRVVQRLRIIPRFPAKPNQACGPLQIISQMSPSLFRNLVKHARLCCTELHPKCGACPLVSFCPTGIRRAARDAKGKPIVVDLFAGAGGLSVGFRREGFHVAIAVEKDTNAAQSYRVNNPGVPVLQADVRKIQPQEVCKILGFQSGQIMAVIAGPPCQGFSAAGPRKPRARRNYLFRCVAQVAKRFQAKLLIMENVPGLKRVNGIGFENRIIDCFREHGYTGKPIEIDASEFGVPQRRKRLIFVCASKGYDVSSFTMRRLKSRVQRTVLDALRFLPAPYTKDSESRRRRQGKLLPNHRVMSHSRKVIDKISRLSPGKGPISYRRLRPDIAHTIIAGHRAMPVHPWQHRTITAREAARIQTMPDSFQFLGPHAEQPLQVANVVPYRLARAVARNVLVSIKNHSMVESPNGNR